MLYILFVFKWLKHRCNVYSGLKIILDLLHGIIVFIVDREIQIDCIIMRRNRSAVF